MFKQIMLRFLSAKRPLLGRWCLQDKSKVFWKTDMANTDHCGTCSNTQDKNDNEKKRNEGKKVV